MKKLRWQLLVVVLALAAIAALLVGQQPAVLPGIPEAPIQPAAGGIYSEALIGSFGRLNPLLDYFNPADRAVNRLIFSGLVRFDERGLPHGDLAEDWGISQDGTVYNFAIRPDAVWHDGEPVNSDDVLFTIDLMREEDLPIAPDLVEFWNQIELEILDEKTLQFRLPEAFAPFMDYLTFGVLPEHLLGGLTAVELIDAPFNAEPVGSGPYRFDRLEVKDGQITGVVLTAFDQADGTRPFIDQVEFTYYPDAAAALAAYRDKEALGISHVTTETLPDILREPDLNLYTARLPNLSLVYLNLGNQSLPFFQDAALRRALLMGINRQWYVDNLLDGQAIVADGPIFPGTWAYYESIEHLDYDPELAVSELKKAGYSIPAEGGSVREKDGVKLSFEMLYPDSGFYPQLAEAIQNDWARLGVEVSLAAVPYEELVEDYLEPKTYEAALVDLNLSRSPDPDPYPFWHQAQITGGQNYAQWDDRQASEYLEQARVLVDLDERTKRYRNFQVRFTAEMPALPLYYPVYSFAVDEQVQGVRMGPIFDPSDRFNTISNWYLIERQAVETPAPETTETTETPEP